MDTIVVKLRKSTITMDREIYHLIKKFGYSISHKKCASGYYLPTIGVPKNKRSEAGFSTMSLGIFILGIHGENTVADHINRDTSDNRSINLRVATIAQNKANGVKYTLKRGCSSKYKGVTLLKPHMYIRARIRHNKKLIYLGTFKSEYDAAKAYDAAALKYYGKFACLNFPESGIVEA